MFAVTQSPQGVNLAPVDIDIIPVVGPIPTINVGMNVEGIPAAFNVVMGGMPCLTTPDLVVVSEGSVGPSAIDGECDGTIQHVMGSTKVNIAGNPLNTLAIPATLQNGPGAPGAGISPSQTTVQVMS